MFDTNVPQCVFVTPLHLDKMALIILENTSRNDMELRTQIYDSWLEQMYDKVAGFATSLNGMVLMNRVFVSEIVENNIRDAKLDMRRQLELEELDVAFIRSLSATLAVGQSFRDFLKDCNDYTIFMVQEQK